MGKLPPEYNIPVAFSASDHEILSTLYDGMSDSLYALISRTCNQAETLASKEELERAIEELEKLANGEYPETTENEMEQAESLAEFLKGGLE